ncbi:hypothetical protein [uncultured Kordia sp.]|uniref:hypothetical protein n=1 Tax=uncultured Kordia sp. TaxID=507699 RepID=UPI0026233179|nr:hypothetical protein [uncultured Kordia sp.]
MKQLRRLTGLVIIGIVMSCNTNKTNSKTIALNEETTKTTAITMTTGSEEIVNVALVYLKDGQEAKFEEYKKRGGALLEKYGGKIERIIKPKMLAKGNIALPDEIHFASYPSIEVFNKFNEDKEFQKIREEYAMPAIKDISIFTSKNTDFKFTRETGDKTKTYGVALVYFKEGEKYEKQFAEYHDDACKIIPEFGAHFERFIAPFQAKGTLAQPNEIHRFYFDSPEGMKQMGIDKRMQALFPKRDESLRNLIFILGEAIQ